MANGPVDHRLFIQHDQWCIDECNPSLTRPITQNGGEIRGTLDRADYMLSIAESSLADVSLKDTDKPGFKRYIKRTPLGVVLVIAPWKYVDPLP